MRRPSRPQLLIGAAALAVLGTVVGLLVATGGSNGPHPPRGITDRQVRIPLDGGGTLSAEVITPRGSGRVPLVVLPASWGSSASEYRYLGYQLAEAGDQVVSYAQPGFGGSGGTIDYAGPATQQAASKVIDWALAHTRGDPHRIGMAGASYGAGVSLLAAAHDNRIRAVVAMSTWTDLAATFDANDTTSVDSLGGLLADAAKTGNLSAQWTAIARQLTTDPAAAGRSVTALSPVRSPSSVVAALNRNHPAIMLANAFEDSIIAPQQLVDFYGRLTGPKRLRLAPGDHGGPEYPGLLGQPDATTAAARAWLAHYVGGVANGIDRQPPIQLQDVVTRTWHSYRSWPAATSTVQLGRPDSASAIATGGATTWTATIAAGTDTAATSGPSAIGSGPTYRPPTIRITAVERRNGLVWVGPAVASPTLLSGTPRLRVDVRSSSGVASLFVYLYDVAPDRTATLMSVTPDTTTAAGTATPVSLDLQPTSWTFAPGHRLALVIDTVDPRWHSASRPGSTVTLSSSASDPASLALPPAS